MAISTPAHRPRPVESGPRAPAPVGRWQPDTIVIGVFALGALALAEPWRDHLGGIPSFVLALLASLVLFFVCGDALARVLVPREWGVPVSLLALPLGAAASGLALTAMGLAHVPLHVSLWLTLAGGIAAGVLVRRSNSVAGGEDARGRRRTLLVWGAMLLVAGFLAAIPLLRTGQDTIYGQNPDAHQVAGIAVLFQHVPPTATDTPLPIDVVPPAWRFRYPIFYTLAGASNLSHLDPIRVFPAMAALMLAIAALGFGVFSVCCLRAPRWAGPVIGAAAAASMIPLHLVWHPYWNQLWGFAMFPYALLFGWYAVERLDGRCAAAFALILLMLGLAYPLAIPYPLLVVVALAIAYRRRPRLPGRRRVWIALLAIVILAPAVAGAVYKLGQGVSQILSSNSSLWGGDVKTFFGPGRFVGTGGGIAPALAVLAVAVLALAGLPRRVAWALGAALAVLLLVDVRLRLAANGTYMDFKHLAFVGPLVLVLAATAVATLVSRGSWRALAGGLALAAVWAVAAGYQDLRELRYAEPQVTPEMFQIRGWMAKLPPGASVRVDVPPGGTQLWVVYMVGSHPVDSPAPVRGTTYAHARWGLRADYAIGLRYRIVRRQGRLVPYPAGPFTQNAPVFENGSFVLRRIRWPARYAGFPDTSSVALVEP